MTHAWSQRFGDLNSESGYGIASDGAGNVVIAGEFHDAIDFGGGTLTSAGASDIFVAKFDALGNHIWSYGFGDASIQVANSVAVDAAGNVLVTGHFSGTVDFGGGALASAGSNDVFVAKFSPSGSHVWSQRYGDPNTQIGKGIATDAAGNVIVGGYFSVSVDFGGGLLITAGSYDIFLAKFDASGAHLWSQRFGDASAQYATSVASGGTDNLLLAGYYSGAVDFGGGVLTGAGGHDIFVAKFDASGAHLWSQHYGDASNQYGYDVALDGADNALVIGYFQGTVDLGGGLLTSAGLNDIFVAKLGVAGSHLWSQRFGDAADQFATGVAVDGADNVVVGGYFEGNADFGGGPLASAGSNDVFAAKFDAAGAHAWSQRFGDGDSQHGFGVTVDPVGNVLMTGDIYGTTDFGGGTLTSAGSFDVFLAKFWRSAPEIRAVRDVPGDQGGLVNVAWDGSGMDTPVDHSIRRYTVWRAISPAQAAAMAAAGATLATKPPVDGRVVSSNPFIRSEQVNGATYYWYLITSLDAYYLSGYSAPIPTLFDSTSVSTEMHYFQVIAHTSDPYVFYTSPPDSGYSVDNLAPAVPQALTGTQVGPASLLLEWRQNTEADLSHYAVYRGTTIDFVPGPGNLMEAPADTMLTDGEWLWNGGYYYKVAALDIHGNESGHAVLAPENVTGTGDTPGPRTYLAQNHPNPFNPTTRIVFGLEEAGEVSLRVYDASGRLVRVLAAGRHAAERHEVTWDGRDDRGRAVASGVYFYRLVTGGETLTRKAVLLK